MAKIPLSKLHSAELQTQPRPASANKGKASETTNIKSPTNKQTQLLKQTTPPIRKSPAKLDSHGSPIRPPSSKLDNPNFELNCDKHERSPQSKMDHTPSSTGRKRLKVSILPNQTAETKNGFNLLERMKTKESNDTRNKKKNNPNPS